MRIVSRIKTLLTTAFAVAAISLMSSTAFAHSSLTASSPGNQSVVQSPPKLELTFNEGVRMLRLTLVHGASHNIEFGFTPSTDTAATVSYDLPALMMGEHTVNWTVIGSDGHPVNGTFKFTVSADGEAAATQSHADSGHHHH